MARLAFAGQEIELKQAADIEEFNALMAELGLPQERIDPAVLHHEARVMQQLRQHSLLKSGLSFEQLGLTLPNGTLPISVALHWHTLETIKNGND